MTKSLCTIEEFERLVEPLIGVTVAYPWKGYGSAIFLELGQLNTNEPGRGRHAAGESCISVNWDWRVEHKASVLYGSSNSRPRIERGIGDLRGCTIKSVSITGNVPELAVAFSNGHCLRSMVMVTGDPEWAIKLRDGRWLFAQDGELVVGKGTSEATEEEKRVFVVAESTAARWGVPLLQPEVGLCSRCAHFVPLDGEGHLLDYGVCVSSKSPFDGRAVNCKSGCPEHVATGT